MSSYQLFNGDCLEFMRTLAPGSVDAVIVDPPYLVTDLYFDKQFDFSVFSEALRVVKDNGYLVSFGMYNVQKQIEGIWSRRFTGAWLKEKGGMRTHSAKMPMCQSEPFSVYAHPKHSVSKLTFNKVFRKALPYKKVMHNLGYKRDGRDQIDRANNSAWTEEGFIINNLGLREMTDVIFAPAKSSMGILEKTEHPTQKPVALISVIVGWLTNPGDLVCDFCMGSGTTGVACMQLGRNFIGCEIDPGYFAIAQRRIEQAAAHRASGGATRAIPS